MTISYRRHSLGRGTVGRGQEGNRQETGRKEAGSKAEGRQGTCRSQAVDMWGRQGKTGNSQEARRGQEEYKQEQAGKDRKEIPGKGRKKARKRREKDKKKAESRHWQWSAIERQITARAGRRQAEKAIQYN